MCTLQNSIKAERNKICIRVPSPFMKFENHLYSPKFWLCQNFLVHLYIFPPLTKHAKIHDCVLIMLSSLGGCRGWYHANGGYRYFSPVGGYLGSLVKVVSVYWGGCSSFSGSLAQSSCACNNDAPERRLTSWRHCHEAPHFFEPEVRWCSDLVIWVLVVLFDLGCLEVLIWGNSLVGCLSAWFFRTSCACASEDLSFCREQATAFFSS
jgi:hypothetical protein